MTPKSDQDEDMSMEEILASIRKFVTDSPPDNAVRRPVYNGDLSKSVVVPPRGDSIKEERGEEKLNPSHQSPMPPPVSHPQQQPETPPSTPTPTAWLPETDVLELRNPMGSIPKPLPHKPGSKLASDILELNTSIPSLPTNADPLGEWDASVNPGMLLEESIKSFKGEERPPYHPAQTQSGEERGMASSRTLAASANSLSRLAKTAKSALNKQAESKLSNQQNMTLEQLIRDMVRPMIKEWVDNNLPLLVEEMVAKEIKRITKHLE